MDELFKLLNKVEADLKEIAELSTQRNEVLDKIIERLSRQPHPFTCHDGGRV